MGSPTSLRHRSLVPAKLSSVWLINSNSLVTIPLPQNVGACAEALSPTLVRPNASRPRLLVSKHQALKPGGQGVRWAPDARRSRTRKLPRNLSSVGRFAGNSAVGRVGGLGTDRQRRPGEYLITGRMASGPHEVQLCFVCQFCQTQPSIGSTKPCFLGPSYSLTTSSIRRRIVCNPSSTLLQSYPSEHPRHGSTPKTDQGAGAESLNERDQKNTRVCVHAPMDTNANGR
jgi:hypothetical protein